MNENDKNYKVYKYDFSPKSIMAATSDTSNIDLNALNTSTGTVDPGWKYNINLMYEYDKYSIRDTEIIGTLFIENDQLKISTNPRYESIVLLDLAKIDEKNALKKLLNLIAKKKLEFNK